jgi:hypothetical protein
MNYELWIMNYELWIEEQWRSEEVTSDEEQKSNYELWIMNYELWIMSYEFGRDVACYVSISL